MAARFEINTNGLGLACKGTAILEINKRTMKTDNIRKLVWTNYVTNVYKNQDCPGSVTFVFPSCAKEKLHSAHFLTVGRETGNNIFFRPNKEHSMSCTVTLTSYRSPRFYSDADMVFYTPFNAI